MTNYRNFFFSIIHLLSLSSCAIQKNSSVEDYKIVTHYFSYFVGEEKKINKRLYGQNWNEKIDILILGFNNDFKINIPPPYTIDKLISNEDINYMKTQAKSYKYNWDNKKLKEFKLVKNDKLTTLSKPIYSKDKKIAAILAASSSNTSIYFFTKKNENWVYWFYGYVEVE